ncbi:nitrilase family protein [Bosea sp. 117]|uniref:nitrilase family protein n=1 Tax=Bosea sp. 117 TaxID=1125973 RepID=UPI0009DD6A95|nr:nitrilase family protein [Bosea sp. 117]
MLIACIQMEPLIGETARNVARSLDFARQAAERGARLVVLPELANTGYVFETRAEAEALAETVPSGPTVAAWSRLCEELDLHLVAGIAEKAGDKLFNSAVLIGPGGCVGVYRKMHLWGDEKKVFTPGDLPFPVYDTPIGQIAMAICYDGWFPETYRLYALNGARLVCVPTNWVPMPGQPDDRSAMANTLVMAAAHTNGLVIACADRVGVERGQPFEGQSLIVDKTGWPLAGPASRTNEEIILADITLEPRKGIGADNDVLSDRRTDIYAEMLGLDRTDNP